MTDFINFTPHETFTASGNRLNFANPQPAMIDRKTIAHHLARINRWTGNTDLPYSVAQHSMLVASAIKTPQWRIYGLLHDGAEAYTGDLPTPFKRWLNDNGANVMGLESTILNAIHKHFNLTKPTKEIAKAVDEADKNIMATEYRDVVSGKIAGWSPAGKSRSFIIKPQPAMKVECAFLDMLEDCLSFAGVK